MGDNLLKKKTLKAYYPPKKLSESILFMAIKLHNKIN
jgi:hypothetical protein